MSLDLSNGANGEGLSFVDLGDTQSDRNYPYRSSYVQLEKITFAASEPFTYISMNSYQTILRDTVVIGVVAAGRTYDGVAYPRGVQRFGSQAS